MQSETGSDDTVKSVSSQAFDWSDFLKCNRTSIIHQWVDRLLASGDSPYARRPRYELLETVGQAFEANFKVITDADYRCIDHFIDFITRLRLKAGFALQDVQQAFELYRDVVLPMVCAESGRENLYPVLVPLNRCLAYTIFRFSDRFQELHEKQLVDLAAQLKAEVEVRTSELRESEMNYKTLVEEIQDGYMAIHDGRVVYANKAFCRMHGYAMEDVLHQPFVRFIVNEDRGKFDGIQAYGEEPHHEGLILEYMRLTQDEKCFPTEITIKNTRFQNRCSTIGLCRDITQRVKMEKRVRDAERMATIGRITASLSHEIRNPLSAIKLNLQILKKNNMLQGNDQRRIDISVGEVNRLENILNELLDFAKPMSLKRQPCDLNSLISRCIELLEINCREKRLIVHLNLDDRITEVVLDPEKIQQAVINLLLNAIEASPEDGTIKLSTLFRPERPVPEVVIGVRDYGKGVHADIAEAIFEPFYTTRSQGTGLGLTNVKRVAAAHRGSVDIDRRISRGTAFYLILPARGNHGKNTHY
ncbi:MAG: ATP-binding protein [Desulfococcus multivorans]|nr:ATP-binding protein [Desulfococcus multivorans]